MKIYKTFAYDVRDKLTKEQFTVYWHHFAGIDFWNDVNVNVGEAGYSYPEKGPSEIYERLSDRYEVEIEYRPRSETPSSMRVTKL